MSIFAVVPVEVIQDRRLTLEQMRVLIALMSFRNKAGDTVWPSRAAIAELTGMHTANISSATSALVNLGWLEKDGKGGYSKSTRYTIKVPAVCSTTVVERATVAEWATVAESANTTVAERATRQVAESATRIEQTNEQTIEQTNGWGAARPARAKHGKRRPLSSNPPEFDEVLAQIEIEVQGFMTPEEKLAEAEAFTDYYQAVGWVRKSGAQIFSLEKLVADWIGRKEAQQ